MVGIIFEGAFAKGVSILEMCGLFCRPFIATSQKTVRLTSLNERVGLNKRLGRYFPYSAVGLFLPTHLLNDNLRLGRIFFFKKQ